MNSIMTAMEKTYSQKIARAFEIVDYFLLIPATFGALVGLAAFRSSPYVALLMYLVLTAGIILLVGYYKHSRNRLAAKYVSALWIASAVYNFLLLLPVLYVVAAMYQNLTFVKPFIDLSGLLFMLAIVFAYITAIVLSLKAYSFDKYKKIYGF